MPLIIVAKHSILDLCGGPGYASEQSGDFTISHIAFYFFTRKMFQSTIVLLKEIWRQFHTCA